MISSMETTTGPVDVLIIIELVVIAWRHLVCRQERDAVRFRVTVECRLVWSVTVIHGGFFPRRPGE